ncbi:MAG TPA: hypothetical protein VFS71_06595 [Flavobacterium sp.]|uniref:hypothetical protein n=1 Tax=Flavobacterium sp. TaxID=239 RepID=UPI002DBDEEF7|nr:hypothetical protein [Flavobacterium sp.]HEU4789334.1 hypothetical protein [Flavobacterium sp.]
MEINWFIVMIVLIGAIALIIVLLKQNRRDEKEIENEFNYFKKTDEKELNDEKDL